MNLRCIVVDDEPLAVKMLENFISRTTFLTLEASFTDPVQALSEIRSRQPHLVFLDIQMPDLSGMELSRMIPPQTRIIFTTAFKQYAFESYEVSALDFLLKPIRYQKFLEAAEKARQWFSLQEAASAPTAPQQEPETVFIKADGILQKVASGSFHAGAPLLYHRPGQDRLGLRDGRHQHRGHADPCLRCLQGGVRCVAERPLAYFFKVIRTTPLAPRLPYMAAPPSFRTSTLATSRGLISEMSSTTIPSTTNSGCVDP